MLMADMLGRMKVARATGQLDLAEATWVGLPPSEAIAAFRRKVPMTRNEFAELYDAYGAKGFTVAGLHHRYTVEKVHAAISSALDKGTTKAAFLDDMKGVNGLLARAGVDPLGRHHMETVFDTHVLGAYAAGRYRQMSDPAVLKTRPFWRYQTAGDEAVRLTHRAMAGRVFAAASPVWDTWYPPNGFRCRCTVFSLSPRDVEREGLSVEERLPSQVEVGTRVVQMVPDPGFAGSPRTQERADRAVDRVRKAVKKARALRAPQLTPTALPQRRGSATRPASPPIYNSAGDLLRCFDADRVRKVDLLSGMDRREVAKDATQWPFFNLYPQGQLGTPPKHETWVDVHVYSQNLDTIEQLIARLARESDVGGSMADRLEVAVRASYGRYDPGKWPDPEVAYDAAMARTVKADPGEQFIRSTETVIRLRCATPAQVDIAKSLALQTEKGRGLAVRRAWGIADIRVRGAGAQADDAYRDACLNKRARGSGTQTVLTRGTPLHGWSAEKVVVNRALWRFLPAGS